MSEIRNILVREEIQTRNLQLFGLLKEFAKQSRNIALYLFFMHAGQRSYINEIRQSEKTYIKKLYEDLYALNVIDCSYDSNFANKIKRIIGEEFSKRIIRKFENDIYCQINNMIDDLVRIIYKDARNNNLIYKRLVKKRVICTHYKNYIMSSNIIDNQTYNYIINTRKRLTYGIVNFYIEKVLNHPICSVCLERFETLENKEISTINYSKCGHLTCQKCEANIVNAACPTCRSTQPHRTIITVNKGYCAGMCCKPLAKCNNYLLSSCGHIFCGDCIDDLLMASSALLTYIRTGQEITTYNHNKTCRNCNINIKYFVKIYLQFD